VTRPGLRGPAAALLALALAACGPSPEEAPPTPTPIAFEGAGAAAAAAKLAHGERLTWVLGCRGCHGDRLEGESFYEVHASNLTRDIHRYDRSEFDRVLREGIRKGPTLWAMPSDIFQHLSEADVDALYAYLATLAPLGAPTPPPGPPTAAMKKAIAEGKAKPIPDYVRLARNQAPADLGPGHALGRYIAMTTCAECHGPKLDGGHTPDLIVAGTYSRDEFERLITQGVPTGGRTLKPMMAGVARQRFAKLTRGERDALYAYLKARAEKSS
jgi:cytochrome c553